MATVSKEFFSSETEFAGRLKELYGDKAEEFAPRFDALSARFSKSFGVAPRDFFSSPGRIEIVGNHTDHNAGKVLAAAITVDTLAAVAPREDGVIEVRSDNYPPIVVRLDDIAFRAGELGTSTALVKGVVDYLVRDGRKVGGFNAYTDSCVPRGSGVSSSSSFELVIAEILNNYFNSGSLTPVFMAKASQYAENIFFGKPCGLMDQSAIALGGVNMIDFKSFENPVIEGAKWTFTDLDIYVVATGGDHSDLTDDYAAIPAEMKSVAEALGGKLLRDIPASEFYEKESELAGRLPARALSRAEHYYEENVRVEKAVEALNGGDEQSFLDIVNASGVSSAEKLKNLYSERGDRSIVDALGFAGTLDGVAAKRVHGGGFAGTILLFVKKGSSSAVSDKLNARFGKENVFRLSIRREGACLVATKERV